MPVKQVNISIKRGDTWSRGIYFQDANCSPIDISGWELRFTVKAKVDDPDSSAVIAKVITTFPNPTAGEAELELTPVDTNQVIGSYLFDIQVKTNNDEVYTILEGIINFGKDITITS